jgi:hypothetical protein
MMFSIILQTFHFKHFDPNPVLPNGVRNFLQRHLAKLSPQEFLASGSK